MATFPLIDANGVPRRRRAVVLGAANGVGAAVAGLLYGHGWEVYGFHRKNAPDVKALGPAYGRMWLHKGDVGSHPGFVEIGVHELSKVIGKHEVDAVIHSLSGASLGSYIASEPKDIERTFNLLAHSFLWWTQTLLAADLLSPWAHIVALSNPCPDLYLRNTGVIGAAKAALEAYVRGLAVELGPLGVRVNCIRFSTVVTPALGHVLGPEAKAGLEKLHEQIVPAGRIMTALDVAHIVSEHLNDEWKNGAVIDATGGATLTLMDRAFYGDSR
jgi:NAD(P)-dependent dehydrogenase (short-subunit alcohol dehydrogenase family)